MVCCGSCGRFGCCLWRLAWFGVCGFVVCAGMDVSLWFNFGLCLVMACSCMVVWLVGVFVWVCFVCVVLVGVFRLWFQRAGWVVVFVGLNLLCLVGGCLVVFDCWWYVVWWFVCFVW